MQAVCPGDVFVLRQFDPEKNSGYTETTYLCVWIRHHRAAPPPQHQVVSDDNWYVEFGGLELGRFILEERIIERSEPVEFPWPRN